MDYLFALVAIVVALVALSKISGLDARIAQLKLKVGQLEEELLRLRVNRGTVQPEAKIIDLVKKPSEAKAEVEPETAAGDVATPAEVPAQAIAAKAHTEPVATSSNWDRGSAAKSTPAVSRPRQDMEQRLATRWFVWLGGAAIAIGGLLFIKYAHDMGLIPPALRVIIGLVAGAALVGAGHVLQPKLNADGNSFVPAALSASGIAIAFGAVLAAYTLYELIGPTPAFLGMGAIALGALALSLTQGPLIAALGVAGSYLTPTLITSPEPSAASFFPYIAIVQAACFAILRKRERWLWLGYAGIAGALGWGLLWLVGAYKPADLWPLGLFAYVSGLIALLALKGRAIFAKEQGSLLAPLEMKPPLTLAVAGLAAASVILAALVHVSGFATPALVLFLTAMIAIALISWLRPQHTIAAPVAGAFALLVIAGWERASFVTLAMDEQGLWSTTTGPEASRYLGWMLASGAIFLSLGAAGTIKRYFRLPWAVLAAGSAVGSIFLAWARVESLLPNTSWAMLALVATGVLVFLSWKRDKSLDMISSGALAGGAALLALFAADRMLDGIWYTLAIAAIAAVYAWWAAHASTRWLAPISAALGSFAALRLFAARELWREDLSLPFGAHWPLYGYGIPVLLLWQASRWVKGIGLNRSSTALEGISLGLAISLVSLELRALIEGHVTVSSPQFLEMAAHTTAWLGAAYGLVHRQKLFSSFISLWGARILIVASIAVIALTTLTTLNPAVTNEPLQGNIVFNGLVLAYLAPAILIGMIAMRADALGWEKFRMPLGLVSLFLGMAYITLETKRVFQGRLMELRSFSNAETYAYSIVWLVAALALFLVGIRMGRQYIRYAGLGVMVLVISKVFLLDMADLEGLYRIASFIGLGLCLVGIGWLYQRFVLQPRQPVEPAGTP